MIPTRPICYNRAGSLTAGWRDVRRGLGTEAWARWWSSGRHGSAQGRASPAGGHEGDAGCQRAPAAGRALWRRGCSGAPTAACVTGALEWIEGPPDVWTAEIEDTCRYPDDDEPGAFMVSIRSDEDGLRIDVEHSTRGNCLDSDWIEGADLAQAKARAENMMSHFVERWRAYHAEHWRQHDADTEGDTG